MVPDEPEPAPLPSEPAIDLEAVRQEAYSQGMTDATARFQAEVTQVVSAFADGCQKIDNHRRVMFQHNRAELVNLLILLVQKILRQELTTPRTIVAATLEAALERAIESEEYYVTLHPDDLAAAEAKVPELVAAVRGLARLVLKTDATMTRGGCLLESAVCTVMPPSKPKWTACANLSTNTLCSCRHRTMPKRRHPNHRPPHRRSEFDLIPPALDRRVRCRADDGCFSNPCPVTT